MAASIARSPRTALRPQGLPRPLAIRYTRRMLLCPVRKCRMALMREERRLRCERGHSFDVARSGYINLLQPQERRSNQAGVTAAAVAGRRDERQKARVGRLRSRRLRSGLERYQSSG